MMEQSGVHHQYDSREHVPEGFHTASQAYGVDPISSGNAHLILLPDPNAPGVKPVRNFSIQTGEEFALEFMRDRGNPKPPLLQNCGVEPNYATGYLELKGILGISHTGSESGSELSMASVVEKGAKDFGRTNSNLHEDRSIYGSVQSVPYGSRGTLNGYTSSSTSGSLTKMKVLCSFGGKILPRPSDGKLRYVGGETRIIRISRDVSFQELRQKTLAIYSEAHVIKYQLPGEDLDALVSVSCDEDLLNMMEEWNDVEDKDGSQKLRMFLFSLSDLDDNQFGLGSTEGDSEIQFVVAVNGMDIGSRKGSALQGLGSTSGNNLNELDRLNSDAEANRAAPIPDEAGISSLTGTFLSSAPILQSSSGAYEAAPQFYPGHMVNHGERQMPMHYRDNSSNYSQFEDTPYPMPLHGVVPNLQGGMNEGWPYGNFQVPNSHVLVNEANPNRDGYIQQDTNFAKSTMPQRTLPVPVDEAQSSVVVPEKDIHSMRSRDEEARQEPGKIVSATGATNAVQVPKSYEDGQCPTSNGAAGPVLDQVDLSYLESSVPPQRVYYSERLPREPTGLLHRISKSDDSLGPQILGSHSRSDIPEHDSIAESVEKLGQSNLNRDGNSCSGEKSLQAEPQPINFANKETQESSAKEVSETQLPSGVTDTKQADIVVNIDDRFPQDFLSELFSNTPGVAQMNNDGAGVSVNMENHEPRRWSYFQKLAQEEFNVKDVSLIDQDHLPVVAPPTKVQGELTSHHFAPLTTDVVSVGQEYSQHKIAEDNQSALPRITETSDDVSEYNHPRTKEIDSMQFEAMIENLKSPESQYEDGKLENKDSGLPPIPSSGEIDFSSLQIIKNEDLEELKELGSGTFGTVYHGKWRGSDIAIKRLKKICFTGRSSEQQKLTLEFWHEAEILSKLHHPNVVAFYGVVQDGPGGTLATVAEYMVDGSLRHVLLRKDRYLDRRKRLLIAMDAAFGMEYLHSKNIVHFDLKCDNLLVNLKDPQRPICKVADFGLSKIKRNTLVSGGVRGTLPWMAPELLNGGSNKVSEKVDVFSFGIVLWEILTGEEPYANMHYGAIIGGIVNNTLRPTIPNFCDPEWRRLMELCWAPNPEARPSFTEIASKLRTMSAAAVSQPKGQAHKPPK
ncbi:Probable serine/threonine-protein kinase SIS8 [Linum perenne]